MDYIISVQWVLLRAESLRKLSLQNIHATLIIYVYKQISLYVSFNNSAQFIKTLKNNNPIEKREKERKNGGILIMCQRARLQQ